MYFTLCIPTMDRFEAFLELNILFYINNPYINEIIITDENGNDVKKIINLIDSLKLDKSKLKLFINKRRLGPLLNKYNCCKLANNPWIALIDSDNFVKEDYFINAESYIKNMNSDIQLRSILSPSEAYPFFKFKKLENKILSKDNLKSYKNPDFKLELLMNTGNYIINKNLIDKVDFSREKEIIPYVHTCDVIYFNTLLFEQLDIQFHIIENLKYKHSVHDGSIYKQQSKFFKDTEKIVKNRFREFY